ncbi:hypothetical protein KY348_00495 [Candidatus Woesearchaeota archaeon]|nr:hypothetical protein [Candidatus Woesearchaeota archaeon]
MSSLINSRKGMKTIVTILSVVLLVFIFIIFIFLFRLGARNKAESIESDFSSVRTEFLLKTFLRTPAVISDDYPVEDLFPGIGEGITNADLVSWTCSKDKDRNYKTLKNSINTFFDEAYEDDWEAWIIYSNPKVKKKGFGHKSYLEGIEKSINRLLTAGQLALLAAKSSDPASRGLIFKLFITPYREAGFGSQVVPCPDGELAQIMLYSHTAFIEIKHLKGLT